MSNFYKWEGDDLLLYLYIQPNAKKNEIVGEYGDNLKIRITAQPVENKANKHLVKFLSKIFAVPTSQISLVKGDNRRNKRVKVTKPSQLPEIIKIY